MAVEEQNLASASEGAGTAGHPMFRRLGGDIRQEDDGF